MYLYVAIYKEDDIKNGRLYFSGKYLNEIMDKFEDYKKIKKEEIEGCIGYFKSKTDGDKKAVLLKIKSIAARDNSLVINIDKYEKLDCQSSNINKLLFKLSKREKWFDKDGKYFPQVCIMGKDNFDLVRKGEPNEIRIINVNAELDDLRQHNNWKGICELYEPLEGISNREVWNNPEELYQVGYACSKIGEPKNGMEYNKDHLKFIRRYRELSVEFFKRCSELECNNTRYPSALAYRYYQNINELTKAKGRRDGNVSEEIKYALFWVNKALEINPDSIKDNYRKGKIVGKEIENFKYNNQWTSDTYKEIEKMKKEKIKCFKKVVEVYERMKNEENKKRFFNEYVKSLYNLGCSLFEYCDLNNQEYVVSLIANKHIELRFKNLDSLMEARYVFEKCFLAESDIPLNGDIFTDDLIRKCEKWAVSPIDKLYRLALVYSTMYYVKKIVNNYPGELEEYRMLAEKYFDSAINVGNVARKKGLSGRNTWFINEKAAMHYIISGDYSKAINLLGRAKDSYIIKTLFIAKLLSKNERDIKVSAEALKSAYADKYNKTKLLSGALLAFYYKSTNNIDELTKILEKEKAEGKNKYLSILGFSGDNK